jgi:cyanophycinase
MMGGGGGVGSIKRLAEALSGGPDGRWVVIPTAAEDRYFKWALGRGNLPAMLGHRFVVLHTRDRSEADRESFIQDLRSATAVWFGGGRQWRLVDAYAETRTEREIRAVLERGGLIAGVSAGATIQGSYLVRGAPEGNHIMMAPGHEEGFGFVTNVAIDQHVDTRSREFDLAQVVACHPNLLGLGIDERTAILVRRNIAIMIGAGRVLVTDGQDHDGLPFYSLRSGGRIDLATWTKMTSPVREYAE